MITMNRTYAALKIFEPDSSEYTKLNELKDYLNEHSIKLRYTVENVYFDIGLNWMFTTLIAHDESSNTIRSWQALSPDKQSIVLFGSEPEINDLKNELLGQMI